MRYILKVLGRVDVKGYQEVEYQIEGALYKARLLSDALSEHYSGCRIILLSPESLVTKLAADKSDAKALLEDEARFEGEVKQRVEGGLLAKPFVVKHMQSAGLYKNQGFAVEFSNTLDNIISYQLLLQLGLLNDAQEIILDVSTGFNTQVIALLEAVRAYIVFCKLTQILKGESAVAVKIATTSPVTGPNQYPVDLYDFDVKAFFDFPLRDKKAINVADLLIDSPPAVKREVSEKFGWGRISKLVGEARRAFNAIKYNAPLALFYDSIIGEGESSSECLNALSKILQFIEDLRKIEVRGDKILCTRYKISRQVLLNLIYILALHKSLTEFRSEVKKREPTLKTLREVFNEVYEKIRLQLNTRFLQRDIEEHYSKQEIAPHEKRNFFAHSGLLKNFVETEGVGENTKLSYKNMCINQVKSWLEKP